MYNRSESMLERLTLDASSDTPLYRQLSEAIEREIQTGEMKPGDRLPPTRLLANQLQLNRTTVSAAYALLEEQRLILSHVGRGSFVAAPTAKLDGLDWEDLLPRRVSGLPPSTHSPISFSTSRPSDDLFPMEQFRQAAREVIDSADARDILQLGSPLGYGPLRRYLSDEASREGVLRPGDDLIITNGCQQALDLLARLLFTKGESVIVEDPVYPGLLRVFEGAGANIIPVPVTEKGVDPAALQALVSRHQPKAIVLTPSFQNPTGSSIPGPQRTRMVEIVREYGVVLIENDIYSELRYDGQPEQSLEASRPDWKRSVASELLESVLPGPASWLGHSPQTLGCASRGVEANIRSALGPTLAGRTLAVRSVGRTSTPYRANQSCWGAAARGRPQGMPAVSAAGLEIYPP